MRALAQSALGFFQRVVEFSPILSDELANLAANIQEPETPRRLHRRQPAHPQHRPEAGVPRDVRRPRAARARQQGPDQGPRGARGRQQDPEPGQERAPEEPARVLPPRADEGDPEGARRQRRPAARELRAAREDRGGGDDRGGEEGGPPGAGAPVAHVPGRGRVHGHANLPRLGGLAALEQAERGRDRPREGEGGPRQRPLRPGEGQGPHPRVPRRPEDEARHQGTDPVLRGPSGRRQDEPRQVHRVGAGTQVPPPQPGRHARRGGDPRSPAHLHRRPARPDHPGAPPRGEQEPGDHPRRGGQDRGRLPGRPLVGAAGGARPGAEQQLQGPLHRPALRPLGGAVHHDRQHPRHGAARPARPHGGDPAGRLHRGGQAPHRPPPHHPEAAREPRPHRGAGGVRGRGAGQAHPRVHARGGPAQPRARGREHHPQGGPEEGRGARPTPWR